MYLLSNTTLPSQPQSSSTLALDHAYHLAQQQLWSPYVGLLINSALLTLLLGEVVKYFRTFRKDLPILKATVVALTIIELTQCGFAFYGGYIIFAKRWGRYPVWTQMLYGNMIPNAIVASITHGLYAHRLFQLCRKPCAGWLLCVAVGTLSLLQTASCLVSVYWYAVMAHSGGIRPMIVAKMFFRMWLVMCTSADLIITLAMTVTLRASRTGLAVTDELIDRLLWTLVPGGLLTGLSTFTALLIEIIVRDNDFYYFIIICLSKIYGVAILACLNLRKGREQKDLQGVVAAAAELVKKKASDEEKAIATALTQEQDIQTPPMSSEDPSSPVMDSNTSSPSSPTYPPRPRPRRLDSRSTFTSIATSSSTPGTLPPQYTSGPSWISSSSTLCRSPSRSPSAYKSGTSSPIHSTVTKPLILCQGSRSFTSQAEAATDSAWSSSSRSERPDSPRVSSVAAFARGDQSSIRLRSIDLSERDLAENQHVGRGSELEDAVWMRGRNLPRGSSLERGRRR